MSSFCRVAHGQLGMSHVQFQFGSALPRNRGWRRASKRARRIGRRRLREASGWETGIPRHLKIGTCTPGFGRPSCASQRGQFGMARRSPAAISSARKTARFHYSQRPRVVAAAKHAATRPYWSRADRVALAVLRELNCHSVACELDELDLGCECRRKPRRLT